MIALLIERKGLSSTTNAIYDSSPPRHGTGGTSLSSSTQARKKNYSRFLFLSLFLFVFFSISFLFLFHSLAIHTAFLSLNSSNTYFDSPSTSYTGIPHSSTNNSFSYRYFQNTNPNTAHCRGQR